MTGRILLSDKALGGLDILAQLWHTNIMLDEEGTGKIFCANCRNCVLAPTPADPGQYVLRVRCIAGKWKKKIGEEKFYKYCTIARRSVEKCDSYDDMGDAQEFMKELKASSSGKDEVYTLSEERGFQELTERQPEKEALDESSE
jgi:hypothetical protein